MVTHFKVNWWNEEVKKAKQELNSQQKKYKQRNTIQNRNRLEEVGLPRLRNLVNVYTSSTNRNDPVYTELPDLIFSINADR